MFFISFSKFCKRLIIQFTQVIYTDKHSTSMSIIQIATALSYS